MMLQALQERLKELEKEVRDTIYEALVKEAPTDEIAGRFFCGLYLVAQIGLDYCADPSSDDALSATKEVGDAIRRVQVFMHSIDRLALAKARVEAKAKPRAAAKSKTKTLVQAEPEAKPKPLAAGGLTVAESQVRLKKMNHKAFVAEWRKHVG